MSYSYSKSVVLKGILIFLFSVKKKTLTSLFFIKKTKKFLLSKNTKKFNEN